MFARDLQPFGVLVEHGIDDVDEGFVAGKEAVAPGEQIAFEPALAHVFAENFHDAAVVRKMLVGRKRRLHEDFVGGFVESVETIGGGFVGAEDAKILVVGVAPHDVAQEVARARAWTSAYSVPGLVTLTA